jgi:hypothetical protein
LTDTADSWLSRAWHRVHHARPQLCQPPKTLVIRLYLRDLFAAFKARGRQLTDYGRWCEAHGCTHAHCPFDCEKPQPVYDWKAGELLCMRCWVKDGVRTVMVPCVPEVCDDA